jgi:hypothetical protein
MGGMQWMDENFTFGKFHRWFICGPHYFACLLHLTPPSFKPFISPQSRKEKGRRNQKKKTLLDEMIEAIHKKQLKQMD